MLSYKVGLAFRLLLRQSGPLSRVRGVLLREGSQQGVSSRNVVRLPGEPFEFLVDRT